MIFYQEPDDFDKKFDVVGCFIINCGQFVLLHRQDDKPQGDTWGIPGGKKNDKEPLIKTACRETFEETGLAIRQSKIAFFKTLYVRYPEYDFVYHIFHTTIDRQAKIKINKQEHKDARWLTPQEALELPLIGDLDGCLNLFFGK